MSIREIVLATCFIVIVSSTVYGQSFIFRKIADSNTAFPGGTGTFTSFGAPYQDAGAVAFPGGSSQDGRSGVFTPTVGGLRQVGEYGSASPVDGNKIAFWETDGTYGALYVDDAGSRQVVLDCHTALPDTSATIPCNGGPLEIAYDEGNIAFQTSTNDPTGSAYYGIYAVIDGNLQVIADQNTPIPGGTGNFTYVGADIGFDGRTVTFRGYGTDFQNGVYAYREGALQLIANRRTIIPGTTETFTSLRGGDVDGDTIVFIGQNRDHAGVYAQVDGTIRTVADRTTFSQPSLLFRHVSADQGNIAFTTSCCPNSWHDKIHAVINGSLVTVVEGGTRVDPTRNDPRHLQITQEALDGNTIVFRSLFNTGAPGRPRLEGVYRADLVSEPLQQERLDSSRLRPATGAKNLVLITHGVRPDFDWITSMRDAIKQQVPICPDGVCPPGTGADKWEVEAYDWRPFADVEFYKAPTALRNGIRLGDVEGRILANRAYDHMHLIAHSAGAGLITVAAQAIKQFSPSTTVHTTYLDAFTPNQWFVDWYAKGSDWSDHYFARDFRTNVFTQAVLPNAYNVDVTAQARPLDELSHSFPHVFYRKTIDGPVENADDYGWPLSREADLMSDDWNPASLRPKGALEELDGPPAPMIPHFEFEPVLFPDFNTVSSVFESIVQTIFDGVEMKTESPSWIVLGLTLDRPINSLEFTLDFVSDAGAEGLLAAYWDESVIGIVDERFMTDDSRTFVFPMETSQPGFHTLAFRLDPHTLVSSHAMISGVRGSFTRIVIEGDTNGDGVVDLTDLNNVRNNFGQEGDSALGDTYPFDGLVDLSDLNAVRNNFGATLDLGSPVPEPSSVALIALATASGFPSRARNRQVKDVTG